MVGNHCPTSHEFPVSFDWTVSEKSYILSFVLSEGMLQYKTLHAHQQSNLVFYVTLCSASVVHRISFSSARSASPFWVRRRTNCYKQKKNKSSNCLQPKMFLFLVPVLNTCCFCFKNSSCSDITEAPGGSLHKLSPTHTVHIKLTKKKKKITLYGNKPSWFLFSSNKKHWSVWAVHGNTGCFFRLSAVDMCWHIAPASTTLSEEHDFLRSPPKGCGDFDLCIHPASIQLKPYHWQTRQQASGQINTQTPPTPPTHF